MLGCRSLCAKRTASDKDGICATIAGVAGAPRCLYSAFATHTSQGRHLPVYAEIPELRMIEMTVELPPFGCPVLEFLPQFRDVQAMGKALLLTGVVTRIGLRHTGATRSESHSSVIRLPRRKCLRSGYHSTRRPSCSVRLP